MVTLKPNPQSKSLETFEKNIRKLVHEPELWLTTTEQWSSRALTNATPKIPRTVKKSFKSMVVQHKIRVMSILPPRFWRQLIGWSYDATSRRFSLVAWRGHFVRKTPSCSWCNGYALRLLCQWFSVRLSPCWLSFFFFAFFQAPFRCYVYGLVLLG